MSPHRPPTLDPKLDVVFKLLFADAQNRPLLVSFLTAVLQPPEPIDQVVVLNPEIERETLVEKGAVLDVRVRLGDGRQVNVEMQVASHPGLRERALYYWARLYGGQLARGDTYTSLRPVVSVFIVNFRELGGARFHSTFRLLEIHDARQFSTSLELHFLELPKLPRLQSGGAPATEEPLVLKWGRFLAANTEQELEKLAMTDSDLCAAKAALDRLSADPKAQRLAEERELAVWNYERTIHLSRAEGKAEGRAEGKAEGRAEGEAALRGAVRALCDLLKIQITPERQTTLEALDLSALDRLVVRLKAERQWPE